MFPIAYEMMKLDNYFLNNIANQLIEKSFVQVVSSQLQT